MITTKYVIGTANICRNLQLRRDLVLRYSFGSGRGATVEFTAGLAVNLCWRTIYIYERVRSYVNHSLAEKNNSQ